MANKFQKSIQERLEQEAIRQKTEPKKEMILEKKVSSVENAVEPEVKASPKGVTDEPIPDISAYLRKEPQRLAKNKTFYLDVDVIEAIKGTAKAQGVTDSKLVCDILRQVLQVK